MIPDEKFEQNVLFEVVETSLPLWELAAEAAVLGDQLDSTTKVATAKELIRRLLQRGWVDLFETEYLGDEIPSPPKRPVEPARVDAVLDDPSNWDHERVANSRKRYLVYRTELGAREFDEQLRRERGQP